jgi:hypothetical protein
MDKMFNAFFGTVAPIFGVITSLQDDIEWSLRITSLVIGIAVGCVSLIRLVRKL